jgi:serine/threonine-protein kinase ATR
VSRFTNGSQPVWNAMDKIATLVLGEFLDQSIWLFVSTLKSTDRIRVGRGERTILMLIQQLGSSHQRRVDACRAMASHLLNLVTDNARDGDNTLSMRKYYPELFKTAPSALIIPIQRSLTANVLLSSGNDRQYKPFPVEAPTFAGEQIWSTPLL